MDAAAAARKLEGNPARIGRSFNGASKNLDELVDVVCFSFGHPNLASFHSERTYAAVLHQTFSLKMLQKLAEKLFQPIRLPKKRSGRSIWPVSPNRPNSAAFSAFFCLKSFVSWPPVYCNGFEIGNFFPSDSSQNESPNALKSVQEKRLAGPSSRRIFSRPNGQDGACLAKSRDLYRQFLILSISEISSDFVCCRSRTNRARTRLSGPKLQVHSIGSHRIKLPGRCLNEARTFGAVRSALEEARTEFSLATRREFS